MDTNMESFIARLTEFNRAGHPLKEVRVEFEDGVVAEFMWNPPAHPDYRTAHNREGAWCVLDATPFSG